MSKRRIAVCARFSSAGQNLAAQEPDLQAWLDANGAGRPVTWYRDTFTGRTSRRPAMQKLEADVARTKIGTLVVWRLDRLGRTARAKASGKRWGGRKHGARPELSGERLQSNGRATLAQRGRTLTA